MTLVSEYNWSGREVGGVILGEPHLDDAGRYVWDHSALPSGTITAAGEIVIGEVGSLVEPRLAPKTPPLTAVEVTAAAPIKSPVEVVKRLDSPA